MAAAQASLHNSSSQSPGALSCVQCGHSLAGNFLARHVCPDCGAPQPVAKGETFFAAFGVEEKFLQDGSLLQKRFYEVSRTLHPDRFTTASAEARQRSLERMSFLNEAYRALRDPESLRDYVLELHGLKSEAGAKGQIPMELAESWFELQEALLEEPAEALAKVENFKAELESFRVNAEQMLKSVEAELDAIDRSSADYREGLARLSRGIHELSYLKSLRRDVDRLGQRR